MSLSSKSPSHPGQLVWCPADPSLGVGVVEAMGERLVRVRFLRLQEVRQYTTRGQDQVVARYEIAGGETVTDAEGHKVRVRRRVSEGSYSAPLCTYELEDGRVVGEDALVPHVRDVGAKERLSSLNLVHPEVVRARMRGLNLAQVGHRPGIGGVLGARAQLLPHQVDVAAKALEKDSVRALLADEVGLGKTVEAALIYAGLRREGRAKRVLVLVPDALCIQWLQELYRKAHELLVLLDGPRIADAQRDFPGLNPFEAHQRMVASLDLVAGDSVLADFCERTDWDLVIVDEAHHLRGGGTGERGQNPAYRLVAQLAARTRHLLLLTATPMALDPAEYHVLLRLLDPARFDAPKRFDEVTERTRTLRTLTGELLQATEQGRPLSEAGAAAARNLLLDDPDDSARLQAFLALGAEDAGRKEALAPVLGALRERHALAEYVTRNRRGPVGGLPARKAQIVALELSAEQALLLDVGEEVMFELVQSIPDARARGRIAGELLRALWATPRALLDILRPYSESLAAQLAPHVDAVVKAPLDGDGLPSADARLAWLVRTARTLAPGDKLLVFVESSIAVRALKDALDPLLGGKIATFHRDLAPRDQDRQVAYFRDPDGPQIMLSTEAGGEGRNFQFCNKVVLYDLPWRPATVEQRIGRIDRVGQTRDVHVLVPYYNVGFEAAVVKVMHQAIGVLDRTVGGIDHALEYVDNRLAALILGAEGAEAWKALYTDTATLVQQARRRIEEDVDVLLDHASFSPERAARVLEALPADVESRLEGFLQRFAQHSKLELHARGAGRVAVEGAVSAAGDGQESGYVATFHRQDALDHEDVEFLSFGHPLVEQAFDWARHGHEASAALALCRGFAREGAAFVWTFAVDVPDDVAEAASYFPAATWSVAVDESGIRRPELEDLLVGGTRTLDRMDPTPLRGSIERWRTLVERNYEAVEGLAEAHVGTLMHAAEGAMHAALDGRARHLRRAAMRRLLQAQAPSKAGARGTKAAGVRTPDAAALEADADLMALESERARLVAAVRGARPRLLSVVAVRLLKARHVSA